MSSFQHNSVLTKYLQQLSCILSDEEDHASVFRLHNRHLQTLGEISFPVNMKFVAWKKLRQHLANQRNGHTCKTIFDYASIIHGKEVNETTLPEIVNSQEPNIKLKMSKCLLINANCRIFLERASFTQAIMQQVINDPHYGDFHLENEIRIETNLAQSTSEDWKEVKMDLSLLRVKILNDILENFIKTSSGAEQVLLLTTKSSDTASNRILCGSVVNSHGRKEEEMTSNELYEHFASNMRMMFEHKYGLRNVRCLPNWKEKVRKLGHAAVTFQLIQNAPQKNISLTSQHHVIKDAAFILYNCARICSIQRKFHSGVDDGVYKSLPSFEDIDFANLNENEEWILVYAFLAQYPHVIEANVSALQQGKLNLHKIYEFLVQFAAAISAYYSRIKVITQPKEHMFATLHSRIYLLNGIERVLCHALKLLNIEPINQM